MSENNDIKPKHSLVLRDPPKSREVYWIYAPEGAKAPEFTGCHPGIIIRGSQGLNEYRDTVVFVPITSKEPPKDEGGGYGSRALRLSKNPNPEDDRPVWAITEQLHTTRLSRIKLYKTVMGHTVPKIGREEFNMLIDNVIACHGALKMHIDRQVQSEVDLVKADYEDKIDKLAQRELELESRIRRMELRLERQGQMSKNLQGRILASKGEEVEPQGFRP